MVSSAARADDDARYLAVARLVDGGRLDEALATLDELAVEQRNRGDGVAESRTLRQAAALARATGDAKGALRRARRALTSSGADADERSVALVELGESLLALGDNMTAARAFADAMEVEGATGFDVSGRIAILRKRGEALLGAGRADDAADAFDDARALSVTIEDDATERRALVEIATALVSHRRPGWQEALDIAHDAATLAADDTALADVAMLRASVALDDGDTTAAVEAGKQARDAALRSVAPAAYVASTLTIAMASERAGDRLQAYTALATGWVTLADLVGNEAAREMFGPHLLELRARWGPEEFERVKNEHDDRRRRRS